MYGGQTNHSIKHVNCVLPNWAAWETYYNNCRALGPMSKTQLCLPEQAYQLKCHFICRIYDWYPAYFCLSSSLKFGPDESSVIKLWMWERNLTPIGLVMVQYKQVDLTVLFWISAAFVLGVFVRAAYSCVQLRKRAAWELRTAMEDQRIWRAIVWCSASTEWMNAFVRTPNV